MIHIKMCHDYKELINSPISKMYGFEKLKYYSDYYSFNLSKNGGVIRLIYSINKEEKTLKIEYISVKHYKDFKIKEGV